MKKGCLHFIIGDPLLFATSAIVSLCTILQVPSKLSVQIFDMKVLPANPRDLKQITCSPRKLWAQNIDNTNEIMSNSNNSRQVSKHDNNVSAAIFKDTRHHFLEYLTSLGSSKFKIFFVPFLNFCSVAFSLIFLSTVFFLWLLWGSMFTFHALRLWPLRHFQRMVINYKNDHVLLLK